MHSTLRHGAEGTGPLFILDRKDALSYEQSAGHHSGRGPGRAVESPFAKACQARGARFAGKYRIIDFALSNCVNSGISDVAVLYSIVPTRCTIILALASPGRCNWQKGASACSSHMSGGRSWIGTRTPPMAYQNLGFILNCAATTC